MKISKQVLAICLVLCALVTDVLPCDICEGREYTNPDAISVFDNVLLNAFLNGKTRVACRVAQGLTNRFADIIAPAQCADIQRFADPCCGAPLPTPMPVPTPTFAPVPIPTRAPSPQKVGKRLKKAKGQKANKGTSKGAKGTTSKGTTTKGTTTTTTTTGSSTTGNTKGGN